MTSETALKTRENMLRDGYCVIEDILTDEFLEELREESERLIANHTEHEEFRYQGQHVNVRGEDNPIIQKLLEWEPSRRALEQLGFGDFQTSGGIIILTKEAKGPTALLAPGLDAMERPHQLFPLASDHISELLSNRYRSRKRLFESHPRHPSQTHTTPRPTGASA